MAPTLDMKETVDEQHDLDSLSTRFQTISTMDADS